MQNSHNVDMSGDRFPIFERILREIKKKKRKDRAFVVGITGIDVSGKTIFTANLGEFLIARDYRVQVINLDDFHNPRKVRYSGRNRAQNYYNRSFDINTVIDKLLVPIKEKGSFTTRLTLLNIYTDRYEIEKEFHFNEDTVVLFEGVFLFRKELSPYIDYKIFLEVPFSESKDRARVRDIPIYGEKVLSKYDKKYFPAQKKYLEEYPPLKTADMIIDNTRWDHPRVVHPDY